MKTKSDLNKIKTRSNKTEYLIIIINAIIFFNLQENFIQLFRDYSFLLYEAKYKEKYGKNLKILTLIAPAQAKADKPYIFYIHQK